MTDASATTTTTTRALTKTGFGAAIVHSWHHARVRGHPRPASGMMDSSQLGRADGLSVGVITIFMKLSSGVRRAGRRTILLLAAVAAIAVEGLTLPSCSWTTYENPRVPSRPAAV